ncbi:sigma-54-dependent Fis family transcriptional regulator [Oceanobacter mangrovi]|uniref:sigma-54-dependent Fis family transcriptional regulator n=1 Tax=Oceanobacter mangrovi TaxID=2862510 RepID=UPI001C8DE64B|nr:sigma-54-dependent Fis family transcriptional regulator [Oceanobacter mangrovi]
MNPKIKPPRHNRQLAPISEAIDDSLLSEQLEFDPDGGQIRLFGHRMLLMHGFAMASLRRELIEKLGQNAARQLLTRIGYQQGVEDARALTDADDLSIYDTLALLPRLREMQGFVRHQAHERMHLNPETGEFRADYFWQGSWEAEVHRQQFGLGGEPACWMMVGYATGATTAMMGRPMIWREVECVAMGHSRCRVIGQPLAECDEQHGDELAFLQVEHFVSSPGARHSRFQQPDSGHSAVPLEQLLQAADELHATEELPELIGASASFHAAVHLLKRVGATDATVLLKGESGVGKERFSKSLHAIGPRADKPMVSVNCAAIPADLVEAELFGVEKGAFTGAHLSRPGRFERAHGGTLFLDEIASLPMHAQGKLLRVLQEGEVERVGGSKVHKVDVRIVAAANRDLREEVAAGRFREDLFFRLNVFPIDIPSLRQRRDDIPLLVHVFIKRSCKRFGKSIPGLTRRASEALWRYEWPGNVRELENMIERAVILADDGEYLDIRQLFSGGEQVPSPQTPTLLIGAGQPEPPCCADNPLDSEDLRLAQLLEQAGSLQGVENRLLNWALEQSGGNVSAAARLLNMRRGQLEYRLRKQAEDQDC